MKIFAALMAFCALCDPRTRKRPIASRSRAQAPLPATTRRPARRDPGDSQACTERGPVAKADGENMWM